MHVSSCVAPFLYLSLSLQLPAVCGVTLLQHHCCSVAPRHRAEVPAFDFSKADTTPSLQACVIGKPTHLKDTFTHAPNTQVTCSCYVS